MTDLLDTAPDTPITTLEHPVCSAPASRPRAHYDTHMRNGDGA